jgi:hypothetical protein
VAEAAAVADLTVAEAAVEVVAAAEAAEAAVVTTVINPVNQKTVKSGDSRTFCFCEFVFPYTIPYLQRKTIFKTVDVSV